MQPRQDHSPASEHGGEREQYLTFNLSGELFAIGILSIREIIEYAHLTQVPMMPRYIRGVINLRGSVVPVVDLLARFGQGLTEPKRRTCVVIVEVDSEDGIQQLGVLVDAVNEVLEIPATDVEPPPSFGVHIRNEFIRGMGKIGERFVILLDVSRTFSVDELAGLASVAAGEPDTLAA
ncbi:MAG: purine-binding chemotaxis protein CheW [Proteobacteria bacterium]|nr:purine-binding chemotaxis protein CheW [Pseudomonadota bacterium]